MEKVCDHTSVGILVWKDGKLLLIERAREPYGFAVPAGHVDGDENFEAAAARELKEEVGLMAEKLLLLKEGRKENPCRREGGEWHYWKVYQAECSGELSPSQDETKRAGWYSEEEIAEFGRQTRAYLAKNIDEDAWKQAPGLEPVMLEWLTELNVLHI